MHQLAIADTVADEPRAANSTTQRTTNRTFARSTVLPKQTAFVEEHPRYEPVRTLGEGGMGEVVLVRDHDIGREVAVKRLKAGPESEAAILRFAEEVRTVGHLEHPGIVPIHDVGIDENGQHYLVMKYVAGETLEDIITKLREGDQAAASRFSLAHRVQIFVSLLQALRYAHEKGFIHRDLKPANVMVGPYGEVMLMDWGIAKRIERGVKDDPNTAHAATLNVDSKRLLETAHGALLGTPLYMSPEQALGRARELDERSDIYSATMLFLELMTLQHPFENKQTMSELLIAQANEPIGFSRIMELGARAGMPAEYVWFAVRGLEKDPAKRYPSIKEMEDRLDAIASGKINVQCHVTFGKRFGQELLHWIDRHPAAYTAVFSATILAMASAFVYGVFALMRMF